MSYFSSYFSNSFYELLRGLLSGSVNGLEVPFRFSLAFSSSFASRASHEVRFARGESGKRLTMKPLSRALPCAFPLAGFEGFKGFARVFRRALAPLVKGNAAFDRLRRTSGRFLRFLLGALLASSLALALSSPARAGFLEDYYDSVGAQGAVTPAGVYQSQGMGVATGGSFVVKVPRKDFTPVAIEAPHLKAGCGGIDVFLGAFALPSREEFVSFLRSIGSAMPGLAFQLALQYLSPDLNEQVTSFRDLIMKMTEKFSNSCVAAQTVVQGAAELYMQNRQERAKTNLVASGEVSDASEADRVTRTDGSKSLSSAPTRKDANGNVVEDTELNLTWSLLKGGKWGSSVDQETLETMMTLLGTVIYTKSGTAESAVIADRTIGARDILNDLYGAVGEAKTKGKRLVCDEPVKCLNPRETDASDLNLVNAVYEAALRYRKSLIERNRAAVSERDILLLGNVSSLPMMRLVEVSSSPRIPALSDQLLRIYSEAAAYEGLTTALSALTDDVRRLIESSSARSATSVNEQHAKNLEDRLKTVTEELHARESHLYEAMSRAQDYALQVEHIERSVFGTAAVKTVTALPAMTGGAR